MIDVRFPGKVLVYEHNRLLSNERDILLLVCFYSKSILDWTCTSCLLMVWKLAKIRSRAQVPQLAYL